MAETEKPNPLAAAAARAKAEGEAKDKVIPETTATTQAGTAETSANATATSEQPNPNPGAGDPNLAPSDEPGPKVEQPAEPKDPIEKVDSDKPATHANYESLEAIHETLPIAPVVEGPRTVDTLDAESANKFVLPDRMTAGTGPTARDEFAPDEGDGKLDLGGESKTYTCLPIKNWDIAGHSFVNGQLTIRGSRGISNFEKILKGLRPADRIRIKTIDLELAQRIASQAPPQAKRGFDSGKSAEEDRLRRENPRVGTADMGIKADEGNR